MVFAQPLFFIALLTLSVPIIIHLFNFRKYRKVYFTNVRFIAEIKQESKKRNQLKHLLILIARLLAISCLVFAFSQPYLPSPLQLKNHTGKQAISVFIDNSFSMEALSPSGRLLDEAKRKAIEISEAFKPSDLFQLVTDDFEGRHQRFVSRDEFRNLVDEVKLTPAIKSMDEVIKRQSDLLYRIHDANRVAYLISDFQKSTAGLTYIKPDTSTTWFFVPVEAGKTNNLYIDSVSVDNPIQQPGQLVKLKVKIRNSGTEMLEKIPLRLTINKVQKTVASFSVNPEGETEVLLVYTNNTSGIQYGTLEISDYPVTWDDRFFFTYTISPAIPVLCINDGKENPFLQALFSTDSAFLYRNANNKQLDYSSFGRYPLTILNNISEFSTGLIQELTRYVKNGGNIIVFPAPQIQLTNYNELFSSLGIPPYTGLDTTHTKVTWVNTESKLFHDVFEKDASGRVTLPDNADLPIAFHYYTMAHLTRSNTENLLTLQNGNPFLTVTFTGKGKGYVSAVSLDEMCGNFPKNSIFVPTLYKIALLSQQPSPLFYFLPVEEGIEITADSTRNKEVYKIRKIDSDIEIIPETRSMGSLTVLYPHNQAREAGNYSLAQGEKNFQGSAFNYNRKESDLHCYSNKELEDTLIRSHIRQFAILKGKTTSLTQQIAQLNQGTPLWKYFILGVLLFLLTEILIVRLVKE